MQRGFRQYARKLWLALPTSRDLCRIISAVATISSVNSARAQPPQPPPDTVLPVYRPDYSSMSMTELDGYKAHATTIDFHLSFRKIIHSSFPTCRAIAQQVKRSWRPLRACMEQTDRPTPTVVYVEAFHSRNIKLFSIMLLNEGLYTHVMISNVKVGYSHFHDSSNQIFDYNPPCRFVLHQWSGLGTTTLARRDSSFNIELSELSREGPFFFLCAIY